jgi:hypothetical protein
MYHGEQGSDGQDQQSEVATVNGTHHRSEVAVAHIGHGLGRRVADHERPDDRRNSRHDHAEGPAVAQDAAQR